MEGMQLLSENSPDSFSQLPADSDFRYEIKYVSAFRHDPLSQAEVDFCFARACDTLDQYRFSIAVPGNDIVEYAFLSSCKHD